MTSPFLTALFRTVHATFAAHGSPGPVPLTWLRPRQGSASVHLAHLPWLSAFPLPAFPLHLAFPGSLVGRCSHEYYAGSVTLFLAEGG